MHEQQSLFLSLYSLTTPPPSLFFLLPLQISPRLPLILLGFYASATTVTATTTTNTTTLVSGTHLLVSLQNGWLLIPSFALSDALLPVQLLACTRTHKKKRHFAFMGLILCLFGCVGSLDFSVVTLYLEFGLLGGLVFLCFRFSVFRERW